MVNSLENIDKSKVYVDRIEGLDEVVEDVIGDTLVGAVSTITTSDLTASKILVSDANGKVAASNKAITDIGGDGDNLSITKNASDKLQTVGVINQNNTSTTLALKQWSGTKAQYDAILVKDSDTLYNITDDTDLSLSLLTTIYPIGSIYLGTMSTCPLAALFGTWVKVSEGRVLQGSDNGHSANTTIEAGLPDINGHFYNIQQTRSNQASGAFTYTAYNNIQNTSMGGDYWQEGINGFEASLSNSIYGNSNTVQPPAFVVNIWQRTA